MAIECWSLLVSIISLAIAFVTLCYARRINRDTSKMTETYVRTFISLLVQPAPNPETLKTLLQNMRDTGDTGSFKLEIEKIPKNNNYRFKWIDQTISPPSITSAEKHFSPTLIQKPPKSSKGE